MGKERKQGKQVRKGKENRKPRVRKKNMSDRSKSMHQ